VRVSLAVYDHSGSVTRNDLARGTGPAPAAVPTPAVAAGGVPVYRVVNRGQEELVQPPAMLFEAGADARCVVVRGRGSSYGPCADH
jgi:hypothetical protein